MSSSQDAQHYIARNLDELSSSDIPDLAQHYRLPINHAVFDSLREVSTMTGGLVNTKTTYTVERLIAINAAIKTELGNVANVAGRLLAADRYLAICKNPLVVLGYDQHKDITEHLNIYNQEHVTEIRKQRMLLFTLIVDIMYELTTIISALIKRGCCVTVIMKNGDSFVFTDCQQSTQGWCVSTLCSDWRLLASITVTKPDSFIIKYKAKLKTLLRIN